MTVSHNGVLIHDNVKITKDNTTAGLGGDVCKPGPIMLQDHGNPVQFRNIWILPINSSRPNADEVQALRDKAAAMQKTRDLAKKRMEAGTAPKMELIVAEADALAALIDVADAERNRVEKVRLLEELMKFRDEERKLTELMIKAKVVPTSAINEVEARLADVKARLAKAKDMEDKREDIKRKVELREAKDAMSRGGRR